MSPADPRTARAVCEARTLELVRRAARVADAPEAGAWLHAPRRELGGLTPAGAAWRGEDGALAAHLLLALDFGAAGTSTPAPPEPPAPQPRGPAPRGGAMK